MSALTTPREVRASRRRGLMARALDQSASIDLHRDSSNFDKVISLPQSSAPTNNVELRTSENDNSENMSSSTEAKKSVQRKLKPTLSITFPEECSPSDTSSISPGVPSPSSDAVRKRRVSKQASSEGLLNPIQENSQMNEETLSSTQHLRTGFFRTIKKQYPTVAFENLGLNDYSADRPTGDNVVNIKNSHHNSSLLSSDRVQEEDLPFMSSMARKRLRELRKVDPKKVDVATGLQWIRLELHEMREQDKALFLQLIKLHTTIKEIRSEMKFMEENCDSPFDSYDGATSYWWPRSNGSSFLPDFSSSDGAHLLTKQPRPMMRRGFSFNQPRSRTMYSSNLNASLHSGSANSVSSSLSSSLSGTAL